MCAAIFCNLARDIVVVEDVEVDEEDESVRDVLEGLCLPVIVATLYYRYQVIKEYVGCSTRIRANVS
jgi:hypothetical protein